MADTIPVIEANLRVQFPPPQYRSVNGENVEMTQAEYDQWIIDSAQAVQAQQLAEEAAAAEKALRRQIRQSLAALDADIDTLTNAPGSVTLATLRAMVLRTDRVAVGLIRAMVDLKLFEND